MSKLAIGVQLYTLRDLTANDFADTMRSVAKIGYEAVELAGYGNLKSPAEVKKVLDDNGLKVAGAHVGLEVLENDVNKALDEAETLENRNIICPYLADTRRKSAADYRQVAQSLTRIGQACKARGVHFGYHNHSFEFETFDGKTGFEILWENSDPDLVKAELDLYWVKHGGHDPVQYINQLGKRVLLVHLKDMAAGPEKQFAEVGTGILDIPGIIAAAEAAGALYGIVEQDDTYDTPPLQAVQTSYDNLKKIGAV